MSHTSVDGVTSRLQAAKREALLSKKKAESSANNGNSSQNLSTVSASSTTSSSRARAAAPKVKLRIEAEALKPGMWKRSFLCGSRSAKNLPLPHRLFDLKRNLAKKFFSVYRCGLSGEVAL